MYKIYCDCEKQVKTPANSCCRITVSELLQRGVATHHRGFLECLGMTEHVILSGAQAESKGPIGRGTIAVHTIGDVSTGSEGSRST